MIQRRGKLLPLKEIVLSAAQKAKMKRDARKCEEGREEW